MNIMTMCKLIPEELVIGAIAFDALLYVKVSRKIAEYMLAQRLETEQLLRTLAAQLEADNRVERHHDNRRVGADDDREGGGYRIQGDVVTFREQS